MISKSILSTAFTACLVKEVYSAEVDMSCKKFKDIYTDGKDLIETMWGGAFNYTTDETNAYTMWWFDEGNVNDAVTTNLGFTVPTTCDLQYYHKDAPSAEGDEFTECHPWKESACCHTATVVTPQALNEGYGTNYHWDRCGPLSQACERFFVQEACGYECDANWGRYRKFPGCTDDSIAAAADASDPCFEGNTWQMKDMPVKASYANEWYLACANDLFCGGGDYFSCAAHYAVQDAVTTVTLIDTVVEIEKEKGETKTKTKIPDWGIALIVVFGCLVFGACVFFTLMIRKEKQGDPLFKPLTNPLNDEAGTELENQKASAL